MPEMFWGVQSQFPPYDSDARCHTGAPHEGQGPIQMWILLFNDPTLLWLQNSNSSTSRQTGAGVRQNYHRDQTGFIWGGQLYSNVRQVLIGISLPNNSVSPEVIISLDAHKV